ncbi:unnamed protein product, partial [Closterium sp. NIES-54]
VTASAISKQLTAWHVPHSLLIATPEEAILQRLPAGTLPPAPAARLAPSMRWRDGSEREGVAEDYDAVMVDLSQRPTLADANVIEVLECLGRDRVGVVLLLNRTQVTEKTEAELRAVRHWHDRSPPLLLNKPMVRPKALMEALEAALRATPGGESLLQQGGAGGAARGGRASGVGTRAGGGKPSGPKLSGRILLAEDNAVSSELPFKWGARAGGGKPSGPKLSGRILLAEDNAVSSELPFKWGARAGGGKPSGPKLSGRILLAEDNA